MSLLASAAILSNRSFTNEFMIDMAADLRRWSTEIPMVRPNFLLRPAAFISSRVKPRPDRSSYSVGLGSGRLIF